MTDGHVPACHRPPQSAFASTVVHHINKTSKLPASSGWEGAQLRAARLVVRSATGRSENEKKRNHALPALREHFSEAEIACCQPSISELLEKPGEAYGTLTETKLVQKYGASLGCFWAALAQPGDVDVLEDVNVGEDDGVDMGEDSPGSDFSLPWTHRRSRTLKEFVGFANSTTLKVGSSPSHKNSSPQAF